MGACIQSAALLRYDDSAVQPVAREAKRRVRRLPQASDNQTFACRSRSRMLPWREDMRTMCARLVVRPVQFSAWDGARQCDDAATPRKVLGTLVHGEVV